MRLHRLLAATALSVTLLIPVVAQEQAFFRSPLSAPLLMGPGGSTPVDPEDPGVPGGSPNNPDPDPEPLPVSVTLAEHTFSPFMVGDSIDHDFADHLAVANGEASDVAWSVGSPSNLPSGPGLTGGKLSGTFDQAGDFDFELVATHPDAAEPARQVYTIVVNGVTLQVTQISAGSDHTCAVTVSGAAKCWGYNNNGQLGDGTTTQRNTPVQVSGLTSGVTSISAGGQYTCAIHNGGAKCWGNGTTGRLGDGGNTTRFAPVDVFELGSGVTSISAGGQHTCAIVSGSARCWGYNSYGQIGDNLTTIQRNTPATVFGLHEGVTSVSAGNTHTCAVHNGAAKCWGYNGSGEVGDGTTSNRFAPAGVSGLDSGVASISAGGSYTCAVHNGAAKCWGNNANGQLGDGTTTYRKTPAEVSGLGSGVTGITTGNSHACAVHNGAAKCWGNNGNGRLGDGTTTHVTTPVNVSGLGSGVARISAGREHTCAVHDGAAMCWGQNNRGQLGDGTTTYRTAPVQVGTGGN